MALQLRMLEERRMGHSFSRYVLRTKLQLQHSELNIREQGNLADGGDMSRRYERVGYKLPSWS